MTLTRLFLAGAVSAALVFAQGHQGPWGPGGTPPDAQTIAQMRVTFLASSLSLTDDQKAKATTIFTSAATATQSIHTSLQTNRTSLNDAVKRNDSAAIDQLSMAAGVLTGQLLAVEAKSNAAFYAILTPDQQVKFDALPHGPRGGGAGPAGFGRSGRGGGISQVR